jgi:hypothetical protein
VSQNGRAGLAQSLSVKHASGFRFVHATSPVSVKRSTPILFTIYEVIDQLAGGLRINRQVLRIAAVLYMRSLLAAGRYVLLAGDGALAQST